ncbi:putative oxidoreductase YcjS [Maioricimonas rarisocia]|uniref:Putative oxidoreductase YcjS n=1 Tax=Maioricimonas rarisocia TaxID=2528026 RepID=A0A517Z3X7_9PLAN|nr:Gfo/Idh/MocA family oxidoreductase [Maioricimonas rarisocia]QDU37199.1 putative oxidoreductase YcjS [Maioricimonas rarisocia]
MASTLRVGIAGLVHDHVWSELKHWQQTGRVRIEAIADSNEPLRQRARDEFGIERFFDSPQAMLEDVELDAVEVCTSNADGLAVVEAACERNVACKIEKPMAACLADADRMLEAARKTGTLLMVNWPNRWRPNTTHAWRLLQAGEIGHVFSATMRMAHSGPRELGCSDYFCDWLFDSSQTGSGALVDYCSYGAAAFRYLFGRPQAVQAVAARLVKTDIDVVDNASITCIYPDRFAFTEASWTQLPHYHDARYLGTEGTLWTEPGRIMVARGRDGQPEEIPVEPLPEGRRNGAEYLIWCLDNDATPEDTCNAELCRDAQEILDAGLQAAASGQRVILPEST